MIKAGSSRAEILRAIQKAERTAKAASIAAVDADALIATYWSDPGLVPAPFWITGNLRELASLQFRMARELRMFANTHLKPEPAPAKVISGLKGRVARFNGMKLP